MRFEGVVGLHDSTQLELKLAYSLEGNTDLRYRVESYWFIPSSLGVNRQTYSASNFRRDLQGYMRFRAPDLPFKRLANAATSGSLLSLLREGVKRSQETGDTSELNRDLRMYGSLVRVRVRARSERAIRSVERAIEREEPLTEKALPRCYKLLARAGEVNSEWRQFKAELSDSGLPATLLQTAANVDEYISLVMEEQAVRLLALLDKPRTKTVSVDDVAEVRGNVVSFVQSERAYRKATGYSTVLDSEGTEDEHYLYRRGVLKKFVASALWLDVVKKKSTERKADMAAAIAAGVAMVVALVLTIVSAQYYMINTLGFVVAATITYMLKDRTKDWLKRFFAARISSSPVTAIVEPDTGRQIATSRESAKYIGLSSLPEQVRSLRARGPDAQTRAQAVPEVVLRYEKQVQISKNAASTDLVGASQLTDIIRVGIRKFLARVDDPISTIQVYNAETDEVELREFPKVYHLNIVVLLHSDGTGREPSAKRLRIVFDKTGILRLEDIAVSSESPIRVTERTHFGPVTV